MMMIKKSMLVLVVAVSLMAVSAMGEPRMLDSKTVDVMMKIDKLASIEFADPTAPQYIELEAQAGGWWQGFTTMRVTNNFPVAVVAEIHAYAPSIADTSDFDCLLEGDLAGFNDDGESILVLDPYPRGLNLKVWAAIKKPNLLARPSNSALQKVAEVIMTISEFEP
jgi:hypothetical protein